MVLKEKEGRAFELLGPRGKSVRRDYGKSSSS